jgi:AP-1 complex subunit mu
MSSKPTTCCVLEILTSSCKPLLRRDWRGEAPSNYLEQFSLAFIEASYESGLPPIFSDNSGENDFFHVKHSDLIFMCVGRKGSNPALIFNFIHSFIELLKYYFGKLEEESIRDNFVLIYELLDEVMDDGYPQFTEGKVLEQFITLDAHRLEEVRAPLAITNAISWRPAGISYTKNEIFLDVLESCSLCVNSFGEITQSSLQGAVQMKVQLSGMPECKLGLNEKLYPHHDRSFTSGDRPIGMEDIKFHRCVKLGEFSSDKSIVFVPPDGRFELLSYRLSSSVQPLVWVVAKRIALGETKIKYTVRVSTRFRERFSAQDVTIIIPVESDATKPEIQCKVGEVLYVPELESIKWHVKTIPGGRDFDLTVLVSVPSVKAQAPSFSRSYVKVQFEIPYFTPSGIQVRYLKVSEKSGYSALPWVRYVTRSGDYTFKIGQVAHERNVT